MNYRSDPGRFSGIKTWDFEAQAGKSRTARLSGAGNVDYGKLNLCFSLLVH